MAMVHIALLVYEREWRQALVGRAIASVHLVRKIFRHDLEALLDGVFRIDQELVG